MLLPLVDRGIGAAAERVGAVVMTGGTRSGIMALVGSMLRDRPGVSTVGVAPAALVNDPRTATDVSATNAVPDSTATKNAHDREALDPNYQYFVLTHGQTWGSETETMFGLAEQITRGEQIGVVVLANGGDTARLEALRFVNAGWPILCIRGSGRQADVLAKLTERQSSFRYQLRQAIWPRARTAKDWGDLGPSDVEVHSIDQSPELLFRRLSWRLSGQLAAKNAWTRWAAFDNQAGRAQRMTKRLQLAVLLASLLLVYLSVEYGQSGGRPEMLRYVIVALPVAIALCSALSEAILPARNWATLRASAEATQRLIYRRWCQAPIELFTDDLTLTTELARIDQFILRSGISPAVIPHERSRPGQIPVTFDELGVLTMRAYREHRLDGQLRYYRSSARLMRTREIISVVGSATLAAVATVLAAEMRLAIWVPVIVFLASTVTVLQQRARWNERIRLYGLATAQLEEIRGRSLELPAHASVELPRLVKDVEAVLEQEQSGWIQQMSRSMDESHRYSQPTIGRLD